MTKKNNVQRQNRKTISLNYRGVPRLILQYKIFGNCELLNQGIEKYKEPAVVLNIVACSNFLLFRPYLQFSCKIFKCL